MADDRTPTDKAAILTRMAESYRALRAAMDRAGPALLTRPGSWGEWTLKDLLAHLSYWHTASIERLEKFVAGRGDEITRLDEAAIDEANANVYRANKERPLDEMMDAFHVTYLTLRTAAKSIPATVYTEDQTPTPLRNWVVENGSAHYEEHLADVERAINQAQS